MPYFLRDFNEIRSLWKSRLRSPCPVVVTNTDTAERPFATPLPFTSSMDFNMAESEDEVNVAGQILAEFPFLIINTAQVD